MSRTTAISWTDHTWNPVAGCSVLSAGCTNCYAMGEAARVDRMQRALGYAPEKRKYDRLYRATKTGPVWTGELRFWKQALDEPLRVEAPAMWFVNSMSDLAHEDMPVEWFARVWSVMTEAHHRGLGHVFQVLTKRPANLLRLMREIGVREPAPGIWLGVSAEDERRWDERVPVLMDTPAVIRWISVEPQLEAIDRDLTGVDWVIQGGESGKGSRPFDLAWARLMHDRCRTAGTAYFLKQLGDAAIDGGRAYRCRARKGGDPDEWPTELCVREWPAGMTASSTDPSTSSGQAAQEEDRREAAE